MAEREKAQWGAAAVELFTRVYRTIRLGTETHLEYTATGTLGVFLNVFLVPFWFPLSAAALLHQCSKPSD